MASAKQIANQKRFAMRAKRGDFKKAITKTKKSKSNPKRKTLEKRLAILESTLEKMIYAQEKYGESAFDVTGMAKVRQDPKFQAGMKTRERMKEQLDAGDW